jgi:alkyl hydroperoxide reductase subunit AhpF
MALLGDEDVAYLKESFARLEHDVQLTVVVKGRSALVLPGREAEPEDASEDLKQICTEVAALSERIKLEILDARDDPDRAVALSGEHYPALVLSSSAALGRLRYFGLPAGYEMSTLVATVLDLGVDPEPVPTEVSQRLGALPKDVHIQVFVTPS